MEHQHRFWGAINDSAGVKLINLEFKRLEEFK